MPSRPSSKPVSAVSVSTTQKATQEVYFCFLSKLTQRSLERAAPAAKALAKRKPVVLADKRLYTMWQERLEKAPLLADVEVLRLPVGEASKTLPTVETTLRSLKRMGVTRNDQYIIAIGGGALLDTAGFIASIYHRGLPLVHVPTTFLAMVDATLGGKTAINFLGAKSQVGSFYLPTMTLIDLEFLSTVTPDHLRNGLIEVVKMAFLAGARELEAAVHNAPKVLKGDKEAANRLILSALRIKSSFVRDDLLDQGKRRHLNLGHTTAHAMEAVYGGRISHGDAVGNGLLVAMELAQDLGLLANRTPELLVEALAATDFIRLAVEDAEHLAHLLWGSIGHDKKVEEGRVVFVLPISPGKVELVPVGKEKFVAAAIRAFRAP